jgi:hypothetical protein
MKEAMSEEEIKALVEILNRAPVTVAERLWLQALIQRLLDAAKAG